MTRAEIQLVRSLADKRARDETGLFVAEGEKLVTGLEASDFVVRQVFRDKDIARASHLKTPPDRIALVEIPRREFRAEELAGRLTVALDDVQNPGNLGTIIRLADWFGIENILCSEGTADCFNPKVVQATMGAIARVKVHYGDLAAMIGAVSEVSKSPGGSGAAAKGKIEVFGTFLEGENIYRADLPAAGIVVLGSEGHGISPGIERTVGRKLFIPPFAAGPAEGAAVQTRVERGGDGDHARGAGSESLNVAVAAAIAISEFRRRLV